MTKLMNSINQNREFGRRGGKKKTFYFYLEPAPDQDLDKPCWRDKADSALPTAPPGHLHIPNSATKESKANQSV